MAQLYPETPTRALASVSAPYLNNPWAPEPQGPLSPLQTPTHFPPAESTYLRTGTYQPTGFHTPVPLSPALPTVLEQMETESTDHSGSEPAEICFLWNQTQLMEAIHLMARNMSNMPMMQPHQEPTPRPKLKAPDVFDGTSAQKLDPFLIQCMMYISLRPHEFTTEDSKVSFIMSYLSGSPYNWFQSQITAALETGMTQPLPWLSDVALFIQELKQLFGPRDLVADAVNHLENLTFRDSGKATQYTLEFNQYAGHTGWNERALYHQYYKGLPNWIKDKFPHMGKPTTLIKLDHRYWERQNEINREKRKDNANSKSGTSNNNSSNNSGSSNSKGNSAGSSSGSGSSNSKSGSNSSNNSKDKDKSKSKGSSSDKPNPLADKLGADGKLKPEEHERRLKGGLCLFCGKAGHVASNCRKRNSAKGHASSTMAAPPYTASAPAAPAVKDTKSGTAKDLVDSGSTHCFIDTNFVSIHNVSTYDIPPLALRLLDGTVNTWITQAADIPIRYPTGDILSSTFFVTKLDSSCALVFGYNWLCNYNPLIDWTAGLLHSFQRLPQSEALPSLSGRSASALPPTPVIAESLPVPPIPPIPPTPSLPYEPSPKPSTPLPHVSLINAVAFARACRLPGSVSFQLALSGDGSVLARSSATNNPEPVDLSSVLEDYHEFPDVFSKSKADTLAPHRPYDLKIDLEEGAEPPLGRMYSLSPTELQALREFLEENTRSKFIRPSNSSHGAPILFVWKKDSSLRLCVDYRGLNKVTKKDHYPLLLISDLLDAPGKAKVFTKIDLRHAYHLVRIADRDKWKTTFQTRYGSFEWRVMPLSLSNAPAAFQRFMNNIFSDLIDISVIVYLDDILIYSSDLASHKEHVKEAPDRVEYLGYILSADGLSMAADKVKIIQDWPEPRKVKDIQSFLGFANFYRRFIYNYSDICVPLTRLTRKGVPFKFSDEARESFNYLKKAFTTAPVLTQWIPDRPIILETDASDYALAAILSIELTNGEIHLVAFHSCITTWKARTPIDIVTNHKNLEYFTTTKLLNCRQARWSEYLSQFNLIVRFQPGKLGAKPDALTRRWDVYLKEGGSDYATVNPHNFRPVFTQEQLATSLRASTLITPSLRGAITLDIEKLHADIREALPNDPISAAQLPAPSDPKFTLSPDSLLLLNDHIFVLDVNNLRIRVLQIKHDHLLADYVNSCVICNRVKPRHHQPYGLLKQLPVPERPWNSISMDLIEKLPPSAGFTDILVIVDRLTKQAVFMPTHSNLTAVKLAELFVLNVFSKHGVPSHVTSDRGSEFVSHFFRGLGKALDIELHFTSGYHPEGDGQTERTNQTLEQYLRTYCNYQQDNWVTLLPLAEFAYNNAPHDATGVSPFFTNKGYHPNLAVHLERDIASSRAQEFAVDLGELHEFLKENIRKSQKRYQKAADNRRLPAPNFKVGDQVFVKAQFF
ncbi:unnamed protein product [Cyclocybe aegerita]|uniref:Reverse transcriptase n=1 Tax=Cyclocybe aegerita TaxID=1973307 RepID=A0A8S0W308_CYCAE|nr:unnamed protein product [Cyclocybe aegerita]